MRLNPCAQAINHNSLGCSTLPSVPFRRGAAPAVSPTAASTRAVVEDQPQQASLSRGLGGDEGVAVAILDPSIAALERTIGMGEQGDPPERVEPLARPPVGGDEQARPQCAAGMAELAAGAVEPAARARAAGGRRARRAAAAGARAEPRARASGAGSACELLAAALERAAGAALGAGAELAHLRRAGRCAPAPRSRPPRSASARGRSAAKSHKRGVGLVADRRDDRDRRVGDGADHHLLVERPQILDRAAAARDDQQVRARHRPAGRQPSKPATAAATCSAAPSPWTRTGQSRHGSESGPRAGAVCRGSPRRSAR